MCYVLRSFLTQKGYKTVLGKNKLKNFWYIANGVWQQSLMPLKFLLMDNFRGEIDDKFEILRYVPKDLLFAQNTGETN